MSRARSVITKPKARPKTARTKAMRLKPKPRKRPGGRRIPTRAPAGTSTFEQLKPVIASHIVEWYRQVGRADFEYAHRPTAYVVDQMSGGDGPQITSDIVEYLIFTKGLGMSTFLLGEPSFCENFAEESGYRAVAIGKAWELAYKPLKK